MLSEGTDQDWILNRGLDVALPRERGIRHSPWALPTATPEAILFFKAGGDLTADRLTTTTRHFRYRDQQDFVALRPTLTGTQRGWLRESIGTIHPEHPWLVHLES